MALSVIIPVGPNREENLKLVLHGLSLQTYDEFETVVVSNDPSCVYWNWCKAHYMPNESPNLGAVNRNRGAMLAKHDLLVFIDSDVVLHKDALRYYAEGFANYRHRAILGLYHWLPPMIVTKQDIAEWERFIAHDLPPLTRDYRHNVGSDPRVARFADSHPDWLYCDYPACLEILSGNMGVSRKVFDHAGGFDEGLSRGVDGAFGIALCAAGHSWSYDNRIVGGHLHHERYRAAFDHDPFPRIIARWHADDSWIGRRTWGEKR